MLRIYLILFSTVFISVSAFAYAAEEVYQLEANYFIRSNPDFNRVSDNKVGILMKGSTFKVLDKKVMADGSEALQILPMTKTKYSNINPSEAYWIYKGNDKHFTLQGHSKKTEALALLPNEECVDCEKMKQTDHNKENISQITRKIKEQENKVDEPFIFEVDGASVEGGELALKSNEVAMGSTSPISLTSASHTNIEEKVKEYSESTQVKAMIQKANKQARSKSQRDCYKFVKRALLAKDGNKNSLVSKYLPGETTRVAEKYMKEVGFTNLLEVEPYKSNLQKPQHAPKGAILIYEGGSACMNGKVKNCGHIEIKAKEGDEPGYIYDVKVDQPRVDVPGVGNRYKLKAVMVKI